LSDDSAADSPGAVPYAGVPIADIEQIDAPKLEQSHPDHPKVLEPLRKRKRRKWWRWRRDWRIALLIGALFGGWFLYAVVWPPLEIRHKIATTRWKYSPSDPEVSISIRMMLRTCEYWFVFWFFYLGASIGSFINVVANRTPRGQTIVSRGSHCPYCDQPLNMADNSPVFGWVALRGRCRTCHLPISPRYLAVEIVVGLMFMILAVVELIGNGINLPHRDWRFGWGIVATVFYPKWDLIGGYVAHCSLFAVAVMLIGSHREGLRFPRWQLIVLAGIYGIAVTLNPVLCPVRWTEPWVPRAMQFANDPWEQLTTGAIGGAVGLMLGAIFATALWLLFFRSSTTGDASEPAGSPATSPNAWFTHSLSLFLLAGTLLGWQAAATVGTVSFVLSVIALVSYRPDTYAWLATDTVLRPQVLALAIWTSTLFFHHCFWRPIALGLHIG